MTVFRNDGLSELKLDDHRGRKWTIPAGGSITVDGNVAAYFMNFAEGTNGFAKSLTCVSGAVTAAGAELGTPTQTITDLVEDGS